MLTVDRDNTQITKWYGREFNSNQYYFDWDYYTRLLIYFHFTSKNEKNKYKEIKVS